MMVEMDNDAAEYGTVPTISRLGSLSVILLNDLYFWILSDGMDEFFAEDDANDSVAVASLLWYGSRAFHQVQTNELICW